MKYINKETGEVLAHVEMIAQFEEEYDGFDPTNAMNISDYYESVKQERKGKVVCNFSVSPQNYLILVTGNCYIVSSDDQREWIRRILSANGLSDLWDYPLSEIDHIVENELNVILVEMYYYEEGEEYRELRWFEVPDYIDEEYVKKNI